MTVGGGRFGPALTVDRAAARPPRARRTFAPPGRSPQVRRAVGVDDTPGQVVVAGTGEEGDHLRDLLGRGGAAEGTLRADGVAVGDRHEYRYVVNGKGCPDPFIIIDP